MPGENEKIYVAVGATPLVPGVPVATLRGRCSCMIRVSGEAMIGVHPTTARCLTTLETPYTPPESKLAEGRLPR